MSRTPKTARSGEQNDGRSLCRLWREGAAAEWSSDRRGTRTSSGGRAKKHVFIEVECKQDEADAVQKALAVILQQYGRIDASIF